MHEAVLEKEFPKCRCPLTQFLFRSRETDRIEPVFVRTSQGRREVLFRGKTRVPGIRPFKAADVEVVWDI